MGEIEAYNDPKGEGPEAMKMVIMEEVKEKKKLPKRRKTPAITIRKPRDNRLVLQVLHRTPDYWVSMNVHSDEAQLIEVKKYSFHYFEIEAKFRRPGLELAAAYVVQNPFLWGQYLLKRDQMKMQIKGAVEKELYYPVGFSDFEDIVRTNFNPLNNKKFAVPFYSDTLVANNSFGDKENIKLMFMTKVMVGLESVLESEGAKSIRSALSKSSKTGLITDTVYCPDSKMTYKFNSTDVYPDILLLYRDTSINGDTRTCQLPLKHVKMLWRSGKRFNPDEVQKKAIKNKTSKVEGAVGTADEIVALVEKMKT